MRRWVTGLAVAAGLAGCAAPVRPAGAPGAAAASDAAVDRGRFFVLRSCAGCHAVGERGASPDRAAPPFRTLGLRQDLPALRAELTDISRNGHIQMPPIYMTPDEIHDISTYIASLGAGGAAEPSQSGAPLSAPSSSLLSSGRPAAS